MTDDEDAVNSMTAVKEGVKAMKDAGERWR